MENVPPSKRASVVLPKPPVKEEEKPAEPPTQALTKSASLSNIDVSQRKVEPSRIRTLYPMHLLESSYKTCS